MYITEKRKKIATRFVLVFVNTLNIITLKTDDFVQKAIILSR